MRIVIDFLYLLAAIAIAPVALYRLIRHNRYRAGWAQRLGNISRSFTNSSNEENIFIDPLLPKIQQKILKNLSYTPISVDTLTQRSGLSVAEINANLVLLEVDDYVQSHPGRLLALKVH